MQKIFDNILHSAERFGNSAQSFTPEVWTALALASVIGGYFLLRGNSIKKAS